MLSPKCCLANGTNVSRKMSRFTMSGMFLSRSTRGDLAPVWNAPQTWTDPPLAWTLAAWQSCWKRPPGSWRTLMQSSTRYIWKRDSSPQMTWDQAATVKFCHLCAQSRQRRRWLGSQQGLPQDPANTVASGLKSIVNRLMANSHSIQIPHHLSEGMGTLEAVFMDYSEKCAFLAGWGLS